MRLYAILCVVVPLAEISLCAPEVNLTSGLWTGLDLDVPGVSEPIEAFYGVRYAEPPLGDLRFRRPVPKAYSGIQDATKIGDACMQGNAFYIRENVSFHFQPTSEDCLHLNIYRPRNAQNLPIAFYIHGGTFIANFNKMFLMDPDELVARENVIVVSVNYRLSLFGFLYLNSTEAPGNQGLHDILLGAKFLKQNARALGGDPDKITLWGQSAGAIGAGFLLSSPLAKDLFHRAILQSGNSVAGMSALRLNTINNGVATASVADCVDNGRHVESQLDDMARCLKKVKAEDLFKAVNEGLGERYTISFQPMHGIDDLLPELPFGPEESKIPFPSNVKEIFTSTVINEGSMFLQGVLERFRYNDAQSAEDFITISQIALKVILEMPVYYAKRNVIEYIPQNPADYQELYLKTAKIFGDLLFECSTDMYTDFLSSRHVKIFRYLWDYRPSISYWPEIADATHGDDISFTMGSHFEIGKRAKLSNQTTDRLLSYLLKPTTEFETKLTIESLKMIGDFMKNGIPSRPDGKAWPEYTMRDRKTVRIGLKGFNEFSGPFSDKCPLWADFLTNKFADYNLAETVPTFEEPSNSLDEPETVVSTTKRPRISRKRQRHHRNASERKGVLAIIPIVLSLLALSVSSVN